MTETCSSYPRPDRHGSGPPQRPVRDPVAGPGRATMELADIDLTDGRNFVDHVPHEWFA